MSGPSTSGNNTSVVARLWGAGVVPAFRGRGVYRALVRGVRGERSGGQVGQGTVGQVREDLLDPGMVAVLFVRPGGWRTGSR